MQHRDTPSRSESFKKVYTRGSVLPFGEDATHEFKGHRNLAVEELPPWCFVPGTQKRSRRAISRALNGFLNTGRGGTAYLGVLDDGTVKGLAMSVYQMDHVRVSLTDLMNRYRPPVPKSRYKVTFVPVVSDENKEEMPPPLRRMDDSAYYSSDTDDEEQQHLRYKGHLLRTPKYCWCDTDAVSLFNKGILMTEYVVEIEILPFCKDPTVDPCVLQLHPVHEDEEGRCYFRRSASLQPYTHQEVVELTVHQVKYHFEKLLGKMTEELQAYTSRVVPREVVAHR